MRVAIDARAYSWAGVGRYISNLVTELVALNSGDEYVLLVDQTDVAHIEEVFGSLASRVTWRVVEGSYYSWQEQTKLVWQLNRVKADLFHFPHFNVPLLFRRPYVVTIHDAIRFIFPGQTQQGLWRQLVYEYVFQEAVARARAVICVSETTARDLQNLPLKLPDAVSVIYEGVAGELTKEAVGAQQRAGLLVGTTKPYVLYVGVWMGHKNLPRIVAAYEQVRATHPSMRLVLTGRPRRGYVAVDRLAQRFGLSNEEVVFLGFVPQEHLRALYAEAACLLLPSLYEGFGLPALEAAALGCPVVVSNSSSLPEIMGRAAEYVNPEQTDDIAKGVSRVLEDAVVQERLVRLGRSQAARYSWRRCAQETLAVYRQAIV